MINFVFVKIHTWIHSVMINSCLKLPQVNSFIGNRWSGLSRSGLEGEARFLTLFKNVCGLWTYESIGQRFRESVRDLWPLRQHRLHYKPTWLNSGTLQFMKSRLEHPETLHTSLEQNIWVHISDWVHCVLWDKFVFGSIQTFGIEVYELKWKSSLKKFKWKTVVRGSDDEVKIFSKLMITCVWSLSEDGGSDQCEDKLEQGLYETSCTVCSGMNCSVCVFV